MTKSHDAWTDRLSAHLDGDLAPGEARAMEEHLRVCPDCRQVREELEAIRDRLRTATS